MAPPPALVKKPSRRDVTGLSAREVRVEAIGCVRADIRPDSIQPQADGSLRLRVLAASAFPVRRFGYFDGGFEEFEEVLSFEEGAHRDERLSSGRAPLLAVHSTWSLEDVLGVVSDPVWDRQAETCDVAVTVSGVASLAELRQKIRERIVTNTSIGYRVYQYRDVTQKGDERRRLLAIDWETREVSLVPMGADPTSSIRAEARAERPTATLWTEPTREERTMDPENETPAASTTTAAAPSAPATSEARAATPTPSPAPAAPPAPTEDGAARELARSRSIRAKLTQARIALDSPLAVELLDQPVPVARATERILDELTRRDAAHAPTHGENRASVQGGTEQTALRQIEDVLLRRSVFQLLPEAERAAIEQRLQGNPFVYKRLIDLGEAYLQHVHGRRGLERMAPREKADAILFSRHDSPAEVRSSPGFHVTTDFPQVMANVANKGLQRAFTLTPDTFSEWVVFGTLPDFKAAKRVALGDAPRLVRKPEGGELTFGTVSDKGEAVQLLTYARGLLVTREMLINDDLRAFSKFPGAFGGASKQLVADLVYSILTANAALADGFALFDATNHLNYVTGSGNSLATAGVAALSAIRALGRRQKAIAPANGETPFFAGQEIVHLRVPENLETAAQQLVASIQAQQVGNVNPFSGTYRSVRAEPRLGAVSQIAFYGMADSSMVDTIEVDYLDGESGPVIESRMEWLTDGVSMKCRLDVGAAATEYRGLYKNDGTT